MDDTQTYAEPIPPQTSTPSTHPLADDVKDDVINDQVLDDQRRDLAAHPQAGVAPRGLQRYDQMAKASAAGLMAHKDVESAIVEISGAPSELVFHLTCTLVAEIDPSAVMELIDHGVIPNVERMLGETFASRDLQFKVAPSSTTSG
ncbi:hypothetical protein [Nesterenkonia sandarakina]|uniref:Uncharacterized protein n=1 Tax=Nesterenkonia sandarakina TaxID=272918 RepID=A0A7Z0EAL5_9MICC|nr:hypothetical protein [Nesterenkonia sandarakina]NYJ18138.1 hypothetical protein [Nesterenkonia sandarakina]